MTTLLIIPMTRNVQDSGPIRDCVTQRLISGSLLGNEELEPMLLDKPLNHFVLFLYAQRRILARLDSLNRVIGQH